MEKRRMIRRVFLAVLCGMVLACSNATAATLYVSSSAGSGGDGSEYDPFNTVAAAISVLVEGDVILLEKGSTFNETLYWPATGSTFALTIGTYGSGADPIWTPGNSTSGRLKVIECERNLSIDGIAFQQYNSQAYDAIAIEGGSSHAIENCTFNDATYGVNATYLSGATVSNCKFIDGYYQMAIVSAGVTLDSCEFTGTATFPVNMVYGSTVTVEDCYFHDLDSASSTTGLIGANTYYANSQVLTVTGSVFYNNAGYVHLNPDGHDLTATFTHNTVYLQEKSFVRDNNTSQDSQVTAKNNIFVGTTTTYAALLQVDNGSYDDLVSDYNLFYDNLTDVSGTTAGTNSLVDEDPLFISTTSTDPDFLRISIESPASIGGEGGTYMGAYVPQRVGNRWYVSSLAGAGGNGSEAYPFNTVAAAVSVLVEGDVILLKKGSTFNETLSWPDTSGFDLTIGAYGSGADPIWTPGNSTGARLKVIDSEEVVNINGISFQQYNSQDYDAIVLDGGTGHIIVNCTFTDASYGVSASYLLAGIVSNCKFIDGYYQVNAVSSMVTLDNCEFTGTAVHPVNMVYGSLVTVQDCYFHDLDSASSTTGLIGANTYYVDSQILSVTGSVFYNNDGYVHLNPDGHDLTATFTNNTAYEQEKSFVRDNNTSQDSQVTAKNNIFVGTTSTSFAVLLQLSNGSYADLVSDYNLFYDNEYDPDVNGAAAGTNSLVDEDPLFLSTTPSDPNFLRIRTTSPAASDGEGGTYMGAYDPELAGNEWYVSSSAGSGGDGTEADPFNTIAAAVSVLVEGDIILLEKGSTFNETLSWPDTSGFDLTIGTYGSGADPIWTPGNSTGARLKVIECEQSLSIDGVAFQQYNSQDYDAIVIEGGSWYSIANCSFTDASYGVSASYLPAAIVTNCKFIDGYFQSYIVSSTVTLDNCEFTGDATYPVNMIYGSTVTVQDCYFHDLDSASSTTGLIGANTYYADSQILSVTGSVFYNNDGYVHLNPDGHDLTATFTNNTAYLQEKSFVRDSNTSQDSQVTAKNNIFVGTTSTTFAVLLQLSNGSYDDLVSDYNLFYDNAFDPDVNGAAAGTNSLIDEDPLFLSTTSSDPNFLRIRTTSPAASGGEGGTYMGAYAPQLAGNNVYVSSSAGSGGDGTEASPFNTIAAAASALVAGDTMLLKKGSTFNEILYWPDTSGFDLTIGTYGSGADPIWTPGNSSGARLKVIDCERNLIIDGIVFQAYNSQAYDAIVLEGGWGDSISNCTITGAAYTVSLTYVPAATISNCKFTNGYFQTYIASSVVDIDNCEFTGTMGYAVNMIAGSTVTVEDCYFHDIVIVQTPVTNEAVIGAHVYDSDPQELTVTGSVFYNNDNYLYVSSENHDVTATFTNNTIYGQEKCFIYEYNTSQDSQVTAKNNIIASMTSTSIAALLQADNGSYDDLVSDYNLFYDNTINVSGTAAGSNSLVDENPVFLSTTPSSPDFLRIGVTSPAATAGEGGTYMGAYVPELAATEGIVVYSKPLFELVLPDYEPTSQEILSGALSFTASKDEYVPVTFSLFTENELSDVVVSVTSLTSGANVISTDDIDLRIVKCWDQRHPDDLNVSPGRTVTFPELLVKDDRIDLTGYFSSMPLTSYVATDIPANTSKQFWMTVKTTTSTVAGEYTGTISVQPSNASSFSINVALTVLPITLAQPDKKYGIYYHGSAFGLDWWPEKSGNPEAWDTQCNQELVDIREHGLDSATTYARITGTTVGDSVDLDLTNLRKSLQFHTDNGLTGYTPWAFQKSSIDGRATLNFSSYYSTPEDQALLYTTIRRVVEKTEEMMQMEFYGGPELYYYGVDEPLTSYWIDICEDMFDAVHLGGGHTVTALYRYDHNGSDCGFDVLGPITDLPNYLFKAFAEESTAIEDLADDFETHEDIWAYKQSWIEDPKEDRLLAGFFLWKAGFTGFMPYNYSHASGDPYDDFDGSFKDMCTVYPSLEGPVPTLQWEAIRAGINDVRYLTTLVALRDQSTDPQKIANANAVIDEIMDELDISDFSCVSDSDLEGFRALLIETIMTNFY